MFLQLYLFFRNVGGNIRDGITGLGGSVMSKPREFAHLIKNKFGSADNINQMAARKCNFYSNYLIFSTFNFSVFLQAPHPELRGKNGGNSSFFQL